MRAMAERVTTSPMRAQQSYANSLDQSAYLFSRYSGDQNAESSASSVSRQLSSVPHFELPHDLRSAIIPSPELTRTLSQPDLSNDHRCTPRCITKGTMVIISADVWQCSSAPSSEQHCCTNEMCPTLSSVSARGDRFCLITSKRFLDVTPIDLKKRPRTGLNWEQKAERDHKRTELEVTELIEMEEDKWISEARKKVNPDRFTSHMLHALPDTELYQQFMKMTEWLLLQRCGMTMNLVELRKIVFTVNNAWHHIQITPMRYTSPTCLIPYSKFYHLIIVLQNMIKENGHEIQPHKGAPFYCVITPHSLLAESFPDDKSLRDILEPVAIRVTTHSLYETGKTQLSRERSPSSSSNIEIRDHPEWSINTRKLRLARQVFYSCMSDYTRILHKTRYDE